MIERLIRAHARRLQNVYDCMPRPVQSLMTSARGLLLAHTRYAPAMYRQLDDLLLHEKWTADQIAAHQATALRRIVAHARATVPFYAAYPSLNGRPTDELRHLPVVDRETVRNNPERFVCRKIPAGKRIGVTTTGTTGSSLRVWYSPQVARRSWAFRMRQWAWAGLKPRYPRLTFFGSRVIPPGRTEPPYWISNLSERQILASIYHLSERTAAGYLTFLRRHQYKALEGFPSVLGILADFVLQAGEPIPMRVTFTDGEPLYPFLREKIENAFACRVWDSYGMTELCGLMQQCERGQMHLIPEYGYLEILDAENQAVRPGEEGYLVWTGFVNDTMPLIRYRIGDRGCWQTRTACSCGRAFPLVVPTITRESDLLRCPDGRIFSPRALNQFLKDSHAFRFCQFLQDAPDRVIIRAVAANGNAPQELAGVRLRIQNLFGAGVQVSAQLAPEPIVRKGGKIPLILQQGTR